jgi:hypothetical protein
MIREPGDRSQHSKGPVVAKPLRSVHRQSLAEQLRGWRRIADRACLRMSSLQTGNCAIWGIRVANRAGRAGSAGSGVTGVDESRVAQGYLCRRSAIGERNSKSSAVAQGSTRPALCTYVLAGHADAGREFGVVDLTAVTQAERTKTPIAYRRRTPWSSGFIRMPCR